MSHYLVVFLALLVCTHQSHGANITFMPGDAFFLSYLTEVQLDANSHADTLKLNYAVDIQSAAFGGFGGFEKLELTHVRKSMIENLRRVYRSLRATAPKHVRITYDSEGNEVATEINGFRLFVYQRDVQFNRQRLALKYNENWMSLPPEAFKAEGRRSGEGELRAESYVPLIRECCTF